MTSEADPHLFANEIKGELYFGAEKDSYAPLEMIKKLENVMLKLTLDIKLKCSQTLDRTVFPNRGLLQ